MASMGRLWKKRRKTFWRRKNTLGDAWNINWYAVTLPMQIPKGWITTTNVVYVQAPSKHKAHLGIIEYLNTLNAISGIWRYRTLHIDRVFRKDIPKRGIRLRAAA